MTVDEVKAWTVFRGIGHAVAWMGSGWINTACNSMISGNAENTQSERPARICRKCRWRLLVAQPVERKED